MSTKTPWHAADRDRIRALVAQGLTAREIAAHVGRTRKSVISFVGYNALGPWIAKPGTKPGDNTHIPEDFGERWETTSQAALAEHYGRSISTINVWVKRLGLHRAPGRNMRVVAPKPAPKPKPVVNSYLTSPVDRPHRDVSRAGMAADFLRQFGSVYRCAPTGRADVKGSHWRRRSAVLTDAEIIERAEGLGWQPDAWRRVAA